MNWEMHDRGVCIEHSMCGFLFVEDRGVLKLGAQIVTNLIWRNPAPLRQAKCWIRRADASSFPTSTLNPSWRKHWSSEIEMDHIEIANKKSLEAFIEDYLPPRWEELPHPRELKLWRCAEHWYSRRSAHNGVLWNIPRQETSTKSRYRRHKHCQMLISNLVSASSRPPARKITRNQKTAGNRVQSGRRWNSST